MTESHDNAVSSQGHHGSAVGWVDAHFQAAEAEYLAVVRSAGFQPGWHLLDAGCGSGSFLPPLAELVGQQGKLTALDLAPENVATVRQRLAVANLPLAIETKEGSITALPFPDNTFDALWCANVTLYLSDAELATALTEFRRVVKPGGLVAIKEVDLGVTRLHPVPSAFFWHFLEAVRPLCVQVHGALRSQTFKRQLERVGFVSTWQRSTLIERWAPLRPVERQYLGGILAFFAEYAVQAGLSQAEIELWQRLHHPNHPHSLLNHPEFYWCEGAVLAVGSISK